VTGATVRFAAIASLAAALALSSCATLPRDDRAPSDAEIVLDGSLAAYHAFVSSQDGDSCVFSPTCSRYFGESAKSLGAVGVLAGMDRLLRCNPMNSQFSALYARTEDGLLIDPPAEAVAR